MPSPTLDQKELIRKILAKVCSPFEGEAKLAAEKVYPEELPTAWIPDKDLKKALKLARIMTEGKHVDLEILFRPFRLTFKTELPDVGSCNHTVECYVPAELCGQEIQVNIKYFTEATRKIKGNVPIRAVGGFLFVGDELICQMKRPEPKQEERKEAA